MNITQLAIIAAHGIPPIAFDILDAVHLHGHMARNRVASYAVFLGSANPENSFSESEYERAAEICFQQGWLKILADEDCEQDRLRWQEDLNQPFGEFEYKAGDVDFTNEGARLFYGILAEMGIAEGKRPYHTFVIGYSWRVPGQVRVFGAYADEVRQEVEDIVRDPSSMYVGASFEITRIEGPFTLGLWWINRFVQLSEGCRYDIYYSLDADSQEANGV